MSRSDPLLGEFIDAAVDDHVKARALLAAHPDLRTRGWLHEETALHFLAIENFIVGVRFCCENGFDVNATNEFGDTALIDVATLGRLDIALVLLEHGADSNAKSLTKENVLHAAVGSGNVELVRRLIKAGARPSTESSCVFTIFEEIRDADPNREELIRLLREAGSRERDPEDENAT